MYRHFSDLEECYSHCRSEADADADEAEGDGSLWRFSHLLDRLTRFTRVREIGSIQCMDFSTSNSVVSSIEFDYPCELIAMAGCSRKIKLYDYCPESMSFLRFPVREITSYSKFSSVCWNSYIRSYLASADYDGNVIIWDAGMNGSMVQKFEEHEKRVWTVDFSSTDPTQLASGGDDGKVKFWCTRQKNSLLSIDAKTAVCSVKFNPWADHMIAFSGAGIFCC